MSEKVRCVNCGELNDPKDVCGDDYCRNCHVSLSFEDCVSGAWAKRTTDSIPQRYARGHITGDYLSSSQNIKGDNDE